MHATPLVRVACLTLVACLSQAASHAQSGPNPAALIGGSLAEPAPPRPGDALMNCIQIAKEIESIMRARKLRMDTKTAPTGRCSSSSMMVPQGVAPGALFAQVGSTLRAMNDPRLMRLAQLAQEKHCTDLGPDPTPEEDCGHDAGKNDPAATADPFKRPSASKPPIGPATPTEKVTAPKSAAPAAVAPAPSNDPFRPANGSRRP